MFGLDSKGSFKNAEKFLRNLSDGRIFDLLESYGDIGVRALDESTPEDTGLTADAWQFEVTRDEDIYKITWYNTHLINGTPLVILLQYGHGTGTGGYVEGRDYINPAMRPIFDQILDDVRKAVTIT